jgi:hypothetical protein
MSRCTRCRLSLRSLGVTSSWLRRCQRAGFFCAFLGCVAFVLVTSATSEHGVFRAVAHILACACAAQACSSALELLLPRCLTTQTPHGCCCCCSSGSRAASDHGAGAGGIRCVIFFVFVYFVYSVRGSYLRDRRGPLFFMLPRAGCCRAASHPAQTPHGCCCCCSSGRTVLDHGGGGGGGGGGGVNCAILAYSVYSVCGSYLRVQTVVGPCF